MIIRPLAASDRDLVKNFYLAFGTEDRRKRFCCTVSDDAISNYVDGLNFALHLFLGAFGDHAELVGLAELAPGAKAREMAFAVRQDMRSRHIGTRLLARVLCHASMLGFRKVFVTFLADNLPMRRMAIRAGMQVQIVSGEAYARRDVPPPSAEDISQWAIDEAVG